LDSHENELIVLTRSDGTLIAKDALIQ